MQQETALARSILRHMAGGPFSDRDSDGTPGGTDNLSRDADQPVRISGWTLGIGMPSLYACVLFVLAFEAAPCQVRVHE